MKYSVLMIDFPMAFEDANTGGNFRSGAQRVYKKGVMSLRDIKLLAFDINRVAAKNCVIAMWGFVPLADQCMEVVECFKQFGFTYVTKFFWIKARKALGMGRNFRNDIEELIFLRRGNVRPFGMHIRNYFMLPPEEHSKKPVEFRRLVELVGWLSFNRSASFLELFARERAKGWTCLGYDIDGMDIRKSLSRLQNC